MRAELQKQCYPSHPILRFFGKSESLLSLTFPYLDFAIPPTLWDTFCQIRGDVIPIWRENVVLWLLDDHVLEVDG